MNALTAKTISDKASTPDRNKVDTFLVSLFSKIERAARKGKTHIQHKFHVFFGWDIPKRKRNSYQEFDSTWIFHRSTTP